jgi:hypothetical protein
MPIEPPIPPYRLTSPEFPNTLGLANKVKVTPNLEDPKVWTISWQPVNGAVKYYVYAAPTPIWANANKYAETLPNVRSVEFSLPFVVRRSLEPTRLSSTVDGRHPSILNRVPTGPQERRASP